MADCGWVDWTGGDCPVPDDTPVEIRYRETGGGSFSEVPQALNWKHRPRPFGGDILAYRILSRVERAALRQSAIKHQDKMRALLSRATAEKSA